MQIQSEKNNFLKRRLFQLNKTIQKVPTKQKKKKDILLSSSITNIAKANSVVWIIQIQSIYKIQTYVDTQPQQFNLELLRFRHYIACQWIH